MKAYKVFNPDWTCFGFQYEVGKTYEMDGPIEPCARGFHACETLSDCFNYYSFNPANKVAEVSLSGDIAKSGDKMCASAISILRELSWPDVLAMVNAGAGNSGYRNSGHYNSGDYNSGDYNSGHYNSGHYNSGDYNSGHYNSGDYNSGHYNSGYRNSGHYNSGDYNSGHYNSGDYNSGDYNSGNWNSGHYNSGDWNSGHFNADDDPRVRVFGKRVARIEWESAEKPGFIYRIHVASLGQDGRAAPTPHMEAWATAWSGASDADKLLLYALPAFSATVFRKITGIDVKKDPTWKARKK